MQCRVVASTPVNAKRRSGKTYKVIESFIFLVLVWINIRELSIILNLVGI